MKGTVRRRVNKDGTTSFVCQVKVGRDPVSGRQRILTGTATSERAARALVHELVERGRTHETQAADVTLNEAIDRWLELAGPSAASTRLTYAGYIRNHVREDIGRVKLGKLRAEDLDRWYLRLRDKGLAPASIRKCHVIVSGALSQARRWGWIASNVAELASPPSVPKPVVNTPDADAVRRMLRVASQSDPDMAMYLRLAAVTGARPGEMCALRWVDLNAGGTELTIRRRISRSETGPVVIDLTKTNRTRTIPLDASTSEVLRVRHAEASAVASQFGVELGAGAYIFSLSPAGDRYWQPMSTSRRFRTILRRHGLDEVTLYSLRHQAATVMIDAGVDAKTVSERLGNSVTTVLTTYTRARSSADRAAADLMGSMYD